MSAKKWKQPDEQFPLSLTEEQREALMEATRLKPALNRLENASAGTQEILFTESELLQLRSDAYKSYSLAPKAHKQRLRAVLDKINDLLHAQEAKAIQDKRQKSSKTGSIYQFKVTLKDSHPPIWRRFQVPDGTLGQLHEILQDVMGWKDSHLHVFIIRGEYYVVHDFGIGMEMNDVEDMLISQVASMDRKVRFIYVYDSGDDIYEVGDGWEHEIVLEEILEAEPQVPYPRCLEGARACPPEDCGGIEGYAEFVEAISDPKHPDHQEMEEWIGGSFDPEKFSVDAVNKELGSP